MHLPAYGVIYSWAMYLFSNIVQLRTCSYNGVFATEGIFFNKKGDMGKQTGIAVLW